MPANPTIVAVIPARMGSTRFPGKPLAPILGRPMVEHVYRRASLNRRLEGVYVATCDQEIRERVEGFGGQCIMTSTTHERASDRVAEAVEGLDADIVVMVQGDEPMVHPEMIDEAVAPILDDPGVDCVNLVAPIRARTDLEDPNTIKVVVDRRGDALYFSRRPIPFRKEPTADVLGWKQVCIIPFRRDHLFDYTRMEPTPLEQLESVDMLRLLEHGRRVRTAPTAFETQAVDTPDDLRRVEARMQNDRLVRTYLLERGIR